MSDRKPDKSLSEVARIKKQQIFHTLRKRICLLVYEPGSRLNERELASEFGVSRTPMRAALQRLENDGLISSRHGSGTIVTQIDLSAIKDIYLIRMNLMDTAAESTPHQILPSTLDELDDLKTRCVALMSSPDKTEFVQVTIRLTEILHNQVKSEQLKKYNNVLFYQSVRIWFLLLDTLEFKAQIDDLFHEIAMVRRSLELGDIRLMASIHKAHLSMVLANIGKQIGTSESTSAD